MTLWDLYKKSEYYKAARADIKEFDAQYEFACPTPEDNAEHCHYIYMMQFLKSTDIEVRIHIKS